MRLNAVSLSLSACERALTRSLETVVDAGVFISFYAIVPLVFATLDFFRVHVGVTVVPDTTMVVHRAVHLLVGGSEAPARLVSGAEVHNSR